MTPSRRAAGFSLVEVTIALGVAGFCLVALIGLLPVGINSNQVSIEQTAAASAAVNAVADLRAAPAGGFSPQFAVPLPAAAGAAPQSYTYFVREDGSLSAEPGTPSPDFPGWNTDRAQSPRYRVTLTFLPPAAARAAIPVRVLVTWPALSDPRAAIPPTKFAGSFEAMTALDRH